MKIKYIDGKCFSLGIKAGAKRVCDNQDHLNEINVFPIPDADTGTNMASTMRTVVDNIRHRRINILQLSPVLVLMQEAEQQESAFIRLWRMLNGVNDDNNNRNSRSELHCRFDSNQYYCRKTAKGNRHSAVRIG